MSDELYQIRQLPYSCMFNPWLLVVAVLLTVNTTFAKEKKWYIPVGGYDSVWSKQSYNSIPCIHLGIIGYTFSKDFSIELNGLGCSEKIKRILITTPQSPYCAPVLGSELPSDDTPLSNIARTPSQLPNAPLTTPHRTPSPFSLDPTVNPWNSPGNNTEAIINVMSSEDASEIAINQIDPKPSYTSDTPPSSNKATQTEGSSSDKREHLKLNNSETIPVKWSGAALMVKCTMLHLHPRFYVYCAPGAALLYPLHDYAGSVFSFTLGMGARWVITQRFTIDLSGTTTLAKWGGNKFKDLDDKRLDSLFYDDKLTFLKLGLQWYL